MSYTIFIKYKGTEKAILNASFGNDGSFYLTDLLSRYAKEPCCEIVTMDFPVNKVGRGAEVKPDEKRYLAKSQLKLSHHTSGFFQVSGAKITSGLNIGDGNSKGVSVDSFNLKQSTNDGGPFMAGLFWGLTNLPNHKSKTSIPIFFSDNEIDYQSMRNKGRKPAFALLLFHFPVSRLGPENQKSEWVYYDYEKYQKPLLLRILRQSESSEYVVGISCLKARCDFESTFGFTLGGGSGEIDRKKGTCKNVGIIFPNPSYEVDLSYMPLDYIGEG